MNKLGQDPDPNGRLPLWWTAWLASTLGTPIIILIFGTKGFGPAQLTQGIVVPLVLGLVVHAVASHQLDKHSQKLFMPMLLLGGWAVMIGVFFFGCLDKTLGSL